MKTNFSFILPFILFIITSCKNNPDTTEYLNKVLSKLEEIESASYYIISEQWTAYNDTIFISRHFCQEYNNPKDPIIGANFIQFMADDTTKLDYGYNGDMRVKIDKDKENITIDFSNGEYALKTTHPSFFNYIKNIIRYTLTTKDSINLEMTNLKQDYYVEFSIKKETDIDFFDESLYLPPSIYIFRNPVSTYKLWISKSNNLPYKLQREMGYDTLSITCLDAKFNNLKMDDFKIHKYFPEDYKITEHNLFHSSFRNSSKYIDTIAPNWKLKDINGTTVSQNDFNSKILLLMFSSIENNDLEETILALNKFKDIFSEENFDFVFIESWERNINTFQSNRDKYNLNCISLAGTKDILNYYIPDRGIPIFYFLDEKQTIRKIIDGYEKERTPKEILNTLKLLLRKFE